MPIETICRELDFKLFIGAMLAKNNCNIIIGHFHAIDEIITKTQNGLYIGKSVFKQLFRGYDDSINNHYYKLLKLHSYSLVYLDEEGGVYAGDDENWRKILNQRLKSDLLKEDDIIATWGEFQKNHFETQIQSMSDSKPTIINTGHPRFDLYKHKYRDLYPKESCKLKEKYGSYILINTNLTLANNIMDIEDTFSARLGYLEDNDNRIQYIEQWAHTSRIFANMIELIHKLAIKFPDINFILRAHPSEDQDFYRVAFNNIDNIIVNSEGSVGPWIIGSELLIHDGCTTAIEAYLANTPVINFKSEINDKYDLSLPNKIGIKCFTNDDVVNSIQEILRDRNSFLNLNDFDETDYSLLKNLKQDVIEDFVNLVDKKIQLKKQKKSKSLSHRQLYISERLYYFSSKIKDAIKYVFFPKKYKLSLIFLRKFPGFSKKEISGKINKIEKTIGYKLKVNYVSDRIIIINKKK